MDYIKLYAATNNQLKELLRPTQTFSRDIKMVFGIEKCKTLSIAKGKIEMRNITTKDDEIMEAMNKDDIQGGPKVGTQYILHTIYCIPTFGPPI